MKRIIFSILLLTAVNNLFAYDYFDGTIYYDLNTSNNTATVTYGSWGGTATYTGNVSIPASFIYNNVQYSVTLIGSDAFYRCSGLTSITIPNSVTSIGSYAFHDCSGLTSITIPNSVTSIGSSAFYRCSGLTSITIPSSVTSIDSFTFHGCSGLTSISVASGNTVYDSRSNCKAIIKTSTNELVLGCINTIIPNSVTSIGSSAFEDCSGLTSITIPNNVTSIGNNAFVGCSGLTSITIPNSVTSIGSSAFEDCSGLTSITIPSSVTSIGSYTFRGCSGLTSISVASGNTVYDSRSNCKAIIKTSTNELVLGCINTIIPNSVTSIGSYAFHDCSGLTSITIPNSVTSIGSSAFDRCSGLTSITIPNSVTSIGSSAFHDCSGLTSITIPSSVTSIDSYTFRGCSGLTSITIPNSVTSIGNDAFEDCSGLTSITIPNSVTSIGSSAFEDCSGLTSITIPNSVTSIGSSAFEHCSGLKFVVVPNSITEIEGWTFHGCSALEKIIIDALVPPFVNHDSWFFSGTSKTIPVYVPAGSIPSYQAASGWSTFTNYIEGPAPGYYMVTTSSTAGGMVVGGGSIPQGTQTTLVAKPISGCKFKQWNDGSTANPRTIVSVSRNVSYHAIFEIDSTQSIFAPEFTTITFPSDWQRKKGLVDNVLSGTAQPADYSSGWSLTNASSVLSSVHFKANVYSTSFQYWLVSPSIELDAFNPGYLFLSFDAALTRFGNTTAPTGNMDDDRFVVLACVDDTVWTKIAEWNNAGTGDFVYSEIDKVAQKYVLNMSAYRGKKNVRIAFYAESTVSGADNDLHVGNIQLNYKSSIPSYTISASSTGGGTVSGGGSNKQLGSKVVLTATPSSHYHFQKWNDEITVNPRTISVSGAASYTAYFEGDPCMITVNSNNTSYGTVTGGGMYAYNSSATLTATPKTGYRFLQWNDGNTSSTRTVTVTADKTYTATFVKNEYTLTVKSNNTSYGTVTGGGTYDYNSSATLTATAKTHYHLVKWDDGNTFNSRIVIVTSNKTYTAIFAIDTCTLTVTSNNGTYGTVSGGGAYAYNGSATIKATPKTGYHFAQWNDGNTSATRIVTVTEDKTYTATFAPNSYMLTVNSSNDMFGTVSGGGTYEYYSTATLTATAEPHYHFVSWDDGNTSNPRIVTVTDDKTYTATFAIDTYKLTVNSVGNGEIIGGGDYDYNSYATLLAIPDQNYEFVRWSDGETANPYVFLVEKDLSLSAFFELADALDNVTAVPLTAYCVDGMLHVENAGREYRVWATTGALLYVGCESVVNIPCRGVFFVSCAGETMKVVGM